jgi:two-component system, OmpR family, sensor kinase
MFSSLRSRLLFSYIIVIGVALCVIAVVAVLYLARNPAQILQARLRLQTASETILQRADNFELGSRNSIEEAVKRADEAFDVRVMLYSSDGELYVDSRSETESALGIEPNSWEDQRVAVVRNTRDASGNSWLYLVRSLPSGHWLLVAAPQPRMTALAALRDRSDDIARLLRQGGLAALSVSFIFAFWLASWIATPLQRISQAARSVAHGNYQPIPPEGPKEIKSLAQAFNDMLGQVQNSQQSQRDFVANISHELKTPLTSIQGFAQAIMDGTAQGKEETVDAARVIHSEADRMHGLVLELLDLARLDTGMIEFQHSRVDLPQLLESVIAKLVPQASEAQVTISLQANDVPELIADGDRLAQVFTNLLDNAVKHTPAGGKVHIDVQQGSGLVSVSLSDSGVGITAEELPRIFERFYQVDKSRAGGPKRGTGLGLAIAKEIVEAHGGTIHARSGAGQGSVFVVKLPLARPDDITLARRRKQN